MAKQDEKDAEVGIDTNVSDLPVYSEQGKHAIYEGTVEGQSQLGFWTRMGCTPESFKKRTLADKHNQLNQTLKGRHLHMIAIGGSIGTGFFVGSGKALSDSGPAGLTICFLIIGFMMFNVVFALGEMAIMYPISGGFYTLSTRFIDPSWGFAMGWNYVFQWAAVLPLELVVAGMTFDFWEIDVNIAVWITIFMVLIIIINVFGVLGYGEEEFWSSFLKLSAVIIFMIIALVCVLGGGPSSGRFDHYVGAATWYNPGAFSNGFKGVCAVFVTAAFSFAGTELVGLAAAESQTPVQSLPSAVKQVFWRITLFYILGLFFVGLMVPYDHEGLFGNTDLLFDVSASPFVIAANEAGLQGFGHFMNVVILISVLSIANSCVYGGSRCLTALAEQGYAPGFFTYVDRAGRPLLSTIFILAFGPIAYVSLSTSVGDVFDWLLALSGLAALFTWGSICLAHIRFRAAWKYHGHTLDEIPFKAALGVYGSWAGLIINVLVLVAQFYVAVWPLSGGITDAEGFFKSYLAAPIVLFFWACGYLWKRTGFLRLSQIDVDSGRRPIDWDAHHAIQEQRRGASLTKRIGYFLF